MIRAFFLLGLLTGIARGDSLSDSLQLAGSNRAEIQEFVETAGNEHGDFGRRAAKFLVLGMVEKDLKTLQSDLLLENLKLAIKARNHFSWAKTVPEEIFLNDVLPYASLDETRESWRQTYYPIAAELVNDCTTATEAAQALNKHFFNKVNVHYNTGRKRPNQSPSESQKLGMATCTGLSIILVDACRAIGVPARVVGTPLWTNMRGNHTWTEIWDDGRWQFTGADEYDAKGLNRGWFSGDAAKANSNDRKHAIWATSWRKTGQHFPMVWNPSSKAVAAVNVTGNYAKTQSPQTDQVRVGFRVFDRRGGHRLVVSLKVIDQAGTVLATTETKAGRTDLNDMPRVKLANNQDYTVQLTYKGVTHAKDLKVASSSEMTVEWHWAELAQQSHATAPAINQSPNVQKVRHWLEVAHAERAAEIPQIALSRAEATQVLDIIWKALSAKQKAERLEEINKKVVKAAGKKMKYLEKVFGDAKPGEKSLWISMHGGGGAPPHVNEQQWKNQIRLYEPSEGYMIAPRAPTNTWNLWHESHVDSMFDRLIENYIVLRGVDPNRVYLLGYSAGGDGVYQLAPRMADRFAAASMMAGHPNDASPLGLRNLPFMIFMGGDDGAYKRNEIAKKWKGKLAQLQQIDPGGYQHKVTIYPGLGHWMQGKDKEALPWMSAHTRNPWPQKVIWHQSNRTHQRFYWLAVPNEIAQGGQQVSATVTGQNINIHAPEEMEQLSLRLNDALLNLDKPIEVTVNGQVAFSDRVQRSSAAIWNSLNERLDPKIAASCELVLSL
jgi:poly(3-hydroxybutyrate) depolymerase